MVYNYTKPRVPIAAMYTSPGPCYGLPGIIGQAQPHDPRSIHHKGPAYPFGLKHGKWLNDSSPGPCYMVNAGMYRDGMLLPPAYSLGDRPQTAPQYKSPGPAAYAPEKSECQNSYKAPAYSFGLRNKHRSRDKVPAPNAYTLDPMLGRTLRGGKRQAPCYSMVFRASKGGFHEDLAKTPGPCAYQTTHQDLYKRKPPQYSMVFKHHMPGETTQKPGPGAHSPETSLYGQHRRAPTFHMGIRHSPYLTPLIEAI